jgi:hypothetical protein
MYHGLVNVGRAAAIGLGLGGLMMCIALALQACASQPPAITVEARAMTVQNQSREPWENVEIWLNDHYRVTRSRMPAGERFGVPLDAFVAGFGQRFVPGRQVVKGIEVTATTATGQAVRLVWGEGRRR